MALAFAFVGCGAVLAVLIVMWLQLAGLNDRADRLETASSSRGLALEVACAQVVAAGGRCAVGTPAPDQPEQPVAVPSNAPAAPVDYDRIVREAVARVRAVLPPGPVGKPGPAPTAVQVDAAVTRVCAGGRCGPSQGAILAAVTAYFTSNPPPAGPPGASGDPGPTGEPGATGPAGPVGRGIARTEVHDCKLTVVYTDGTVDGPFDVCAPSPTPSSSPTEPPLVSIPG